MIRSLDLRGKAFSKAGYQKAIPRASLDIAAAMTVIEPILQRVKTGTEEDLLQLAQEFDGVRPDSIRVPQSALDKALAELDPKVRAALELSADRIRKVHNDQTREDITTKVVDGGVVTERWIPVDRVGLYVPGGRAVYPSSVLMNVIPAQIAKVSSIAVASPPQKEFGGLPHPTILAACALLGISEVYAIGGAQAIALFAYGMDGVCEKCDLVTGPGNIYVAAAKRALRGVIGIDSEAGPTEIAILADETALAADVAADLISQAEHDVIAAAVLVTTSEKLAAGVVK
jgi:histidinol dehydrogenase